MKDVLVHKTAEAYRKLVFAMAYPGQRRNLSDELSEYSDINGLYRASSLILRIVLDEMVSFHIDSDKGFQISKEISAYTYSRPVDASNADFIVFRNSEEFDANKLFSFKIGTLQEPSESAFLIFEYKDLNRGEKFKIKGPGIKEEFELQLPINEDFMKKRESIACKFPLGIDMVFVGENAEIIAIPRTSKLRKVS